MTERPDLVVVFDVGKTNAKLTAFAVDDLRIVGTLSTPNAPLAGPPFDRVDTARLWAFLTDGLAELGRAGRIRDIVPTTHACAAALVDADGLVLPIMDYEWEGLNAWAERYAPHRPPFAETGSPALPLGLNLGRQLFALEAMEAEAFARAGAILPYPQYWAWRLCGRTPESRASDVSSLGCHSDLWAPHDAGFSSLAQARGWDRLIAPVRPSANSAGRLDPALVADLGLDEPPRVRVGIHDSNAALLPFLGDDGEAFAYVSSGTWAIAFAVGGSGGPLDEARDCLLNVDVRGRPVPSGRTMAGREYALLTDGIAEDVAATLDDAARVMAAGMMVLPAVVPGVGPHPAHVSRTLGPPAADPASRRAGASLYTALMLRDVLTLIGAAGPVLLDGHLGCDPIVAPVLSAVLGRPVLSTEADTSRGAATLAVPQAMPAPARAAEPLAPALADLAHRHAALWDALLRD